jgi:hypothetical protein
MTEHVTTASLHADAQGMAYGAALLIITTDVTPEEAGCIHAG